MNNPGSYEDLCQKFEKDGAINDKKGYRYIIHQGIKWYVSYYETKQPLFTRYPRK